MGKITTQSDAIFVMEKNITQLEDQLAQSETDKSRYKIELKTKTRELEFAIDDSKQHEVLKTKLIDEHLKMSSKVEGLEKLTNYYTQVYIYIYIYIIYILVRWSIGSEQNINQ